MSIQGFNPNAATRDALAIKHATDAGAKSAVQMTGSPATEKAKENKQAESGTLSEAARQALIQDELSDGADTAAEQNKTGVADDAAQSLRTRRKDENRSTDELGDNQVGGQVEPEVVHQTSGSGDAGGHFEDETFEMTAVQERALDEADAKALDLNRDLAPEQVAAATNVVKQQPLDQIDFKPGPPEVEEQVAGLELGPAEKLEDAARPLVDDIKEPGNDVHSQPMVLEDTHAEGMAREAIAAKMANGEMQAGEEFMVGAPGVNGAAEVQETGQISQMDMARGHVDASIGHFNAMNECYSDPTIWKDDGTGLMTQKDWDGILSGTKDRWDGHVRSIVQGQIDRGEFDAAKAGVTLDADGKLGGDFNVPAAFKSGAMSEEQLQAVRGWAQAEVTNEWAHQRCAQEDVQNNPQAFRSLENMAFHATLVGAHNDAANAILMGDQERIGKTQGHIRDTHGYHNQIQQHLGGGRPQQQQAEGQDDQAAAGMMEAMAQSRGQAPDLSDYGDVPLPGVNPGGKGSERVAMSPTRTE